MGIVYGIAVGLLIAIGVYHLLGRDIFRIVFGIYIILNTLNLLVLSVGATPFRNSPFAQLPPPYADPLVQAMVLTAIIIGFGLATFLLFATSRLARIRNSLESSEIRKWRH